MVFTDRKFGAALLLFLNALAPSSFAGPATPRQPSNQSRIDIFIKALNLNKRADTELATGDYDGAIAAYSEALQITEPDSKWMVRLRRGWAYMARPETYDKAFDDFEDIIQAKPDATTGYLWRGVLRFLTGKTELARQDLSEAMKRNPKFPDTVNWS
jgi:tetratricopeptide (TPR) repeat protein